MLKYARVCEGQRNVNFIITVHEILRTYVYLCQLCKPLQAD